MSVSVVGTNPLEHLWDILARQLRNRQPPPVSLNNVEYTLVEKGNEIHQERIKRLNFKY